MLVVIESIEVEVESAGSHDAVVAHCCPVQKASARVHVRPGIPGGSVRVIDDGDIGHYLERQLASI